MKTALKLLLSLALAVALSINTELIDHYNQTLSSCLKQFAPLKMASLLFLLFFCPLVHPRPLQPQEETATA
uniref:Uncharacterized protein n=1 Tax=Knipowitschia caucasica TaxID=637954 RepID=A0AAV2JI45_KNICA